MGNAHSKMSSVGENINSNITYKPDGTHIAVGNRVCSWVKFVHYKAKSTWDFPFALPLMVFKTRLLGEVFTLL